MQEDGIGMFDLGTLARTPHVAKWSDDVKKDPTNFEFNVTGTFPSDGNVKKAILKSAYWYCFTRWGFQFPKSFGGSIMRGYINGDCDYPIELPYMYWLEEEYCKISRRNFIYQFTKGVIEFYC